MSESAQYIFLLEAAVAGCRADLVVNGVRVTALDGRSAPRESLPVNPFIIEGRNSLSLRLSPYPAPNREEHARFDVSASASATVKSFPPGVYPDEFPSSPLLSVNWTASSMSAPARDQSLINRAVDADIGASKGRWSWQDAEMLHFDAATIQAALAVLDQVRHGLARADATAFLDAAEVRFEDIARAYNMSADANRIQFREQLRRHAAQQLWALEPIRRDMFAPRLSDDGRLMECVDRNDVPVLRAVDRPDGLPGLQWPVQLANLGGQLRIVR